MSTILSSTPDGLGFYYGFAEGDNRQINVRYETDLDWVAYVGGENVGSFHLTRESAEAAAIQWAKEHPDGGQ